MPLSSSAGLAVPELALRALALGAAGARDIPGLPAGGSLPLAGPLGVALEVAPDAPRGGQITPPHVVSLHLKSGAFGFRFPSRLSHIGPSHLGQLGTGDAASGVLGWLIAIAAGESKN